MDPDQPKTNDAQDYSIVVRFGDAVLEAGHTSIPNLVLNHYAELDVTPGELVFMLLCLQHKWSRGNPHPSLGTIAARMDVSRRQVRTYAASLRKKGLLRVEERTDPLKGQMTSVYDFGLLLAAVVRLSSTPRKDPSEGGRKFSSEGPRKDSSALKEDEEQEYSTSSSSRTLIETGGSDTPDSVRPPSRRLPAANPIPVRTAGGSSSVAEILAKRLKVAKEPVHVTEGATPLGSDSGYLEAGILEISEAIGDVGDLRANVARARRLMKVHAMDESGFMVCAMRAHALLKERARTGRRSVRRPGAYYFSILEGILDEVRQRKRDSGPGTADAAVDGHLAQERAS
ncbi:MAG: hypothetical protein ACKVT1_08590 [Dehalococcoidia bacterium]